MVSIVYWLKGEDRSNSLYLNISRGEDCPNECFFCPRKEKEGIEGHVLKLEEEPSLGEITQAIDEVINTPPGRIHRGVWSEVVFCGLGEPLVRFYDVVEVARYVKQKYPSRKVRIDTNGHGYLLAYMCRREGLRLSSLTGEERDELAGKIDNLTDEELDEIICEVVAELTDADVDELIVSANSPTEELYNRICNPIYSEVAFKAMRKLVENAKDSKDIGVVVSAVNIAQVNMSDMREFARGLGIEFKKRGFRPWALW